jgi:hypothetical protein
MDEVVMIARIIAASADGSSVKWDSIELRDRIFIVAG